MNLKIRKFNLVEASWEVHGGVLANIRKLVFIVEQKVPEEEEWDGQDEICWHWLATDHEERPIGTARLLPDGQIGRMAVIGEFRGEGVGGALLEQAVEKARHLGMDQVFLNAQTHALAFYEKAGFVKDGDEFMEAGIPHLRMIQALEPPIVPAQRYLSQATDQSIGIKPFDTREVKWSEIRRPIRRLRDTVMVRELGLPEDLVEDESDVDTLHWIATDDDEHVIGAIRMTVDGMVSRLVVAESARHLGVGTSLLELTVSKARRFNLSRVHLAALDSLGQFYRNAGFSANGEPYEAAGQIHQDYELHIESDDVHGQLRAQSADSIRQHTNGKLMDQEAPARQLGVTTDYVLLRREQEFRNVTLEMASQASSSIRLYAPVLDHKLYDHRDLRDSLSALARRNKYTQVRILLFDSHRAVKNGHVLVELARRLPSSMNIRIVHPDYRQQNHEYMIADDRGVIYRLDYEAYEGYANFKDWTDGNKYSRQFDNAWRSSLADPYLRQLRI